MRQQVAARRQLVLSISALADAFNGNDELGSTVTDFCLSALGSCFESSAVALPTAGIGPAIATGFGS